MNIRRLVAVALLVGCILGGTTALAAPAPDSGGAVQEARSQSTDAAIAAWFDELDRTHNEVPSGPGVRPRQYVPSQGGYSHVIDNFEQAEKDLSYYNGWVLVEDLEGPLFGEYKWGVSDCRAKSGTGSRSAWGIGNGAQGSTLSCGDYYPHGVSSSALLRLDLSGFPADVDSLELVFDFWLNLRTEIEGGVVPDGLFVAYHLPTAVWDQNFERIILAKLTGQLPDRFWDTPWRIPLNAATDLNDPTRVFNLAGLVDVDIEFLMKTKQRDGTTYPEGVFIDNVRLEASTAPGTPSPRTPTSVTPRPTTPVTPGTPTTVTPSVTTQTPTQTPTRTPTVTPSGGTPTTETPTTETPATETPTDTPTIETPTDTPTIETATDTPTVESPTPSVGAVIYLPAAFKRSLIVPGPIEEPSPDVTTEPTQTTPSPPGPGLGFDILEANGSGVSGHANMAQEDEGISVDIQLTGVAAGSEHPAQLFFGPCGDPGEVVLPLSAVVDGQSTTLLAGEDLLDYADASHSIRIHQSATDALIVACGNIPEYTEP